ARRDDRDPRRRGGRRGVGSAAAAEGCGRVGHPRLTDREDRPVTSTQGEAVALRLRRLDLAKAPLDPAVVAERETLTRRSAIPNASVRDDTRLILADVQRGGDEAVRAANRQFGGGLADGRLTIDRSELLAARDRLPPSVRQALDRAIANVTRFAQSQRPETTSTTISPGIAIERRWTPIGRVGAYVPGGSAAY